MVEFNKLGGIVAQEEVELKRAKNVDLITFPKDITGTNCFNCKWIREKKAHVGYCSNHKVAQEVNQRMCCILWSREGEYRQFSGRLEKYD